MKSALRRGFSLIGMLITFACIVILFAILMQSMNTRITGNGSTKQGTVRSMQEEMQLNALFQSMFADANRFRGRLIMPSLLGNGLSKSKNTTANLFSAMVIENYTNPEQLISPNEHSGYVRAYLDYNYQAYRPNEGIFWDPNFKADLEDLSHVSYAHMPLYGKRMDRNWKSNAQSSFPLIGNRGPKNGVEDPTSMTYGRNEKWAGHIVFGDGHVEFTKSFTSNKLTVNVRGQQQPDNVFAMEEGARGGDAIIAFTKEMTSGGPILQWD